ncbi:MAG: flagellin lysine-N-methylase [Eubacteriales bacterium]|nr:flagellin lysine-N-methylase [Eubacteriales bacterium]
MKYYYPDYFDHFQCVPGKACPDSCCIRWQIIVDPETLEKYKKVDGELGKRMSEKIDFRTGKITPHGCDNRCEFLNEDNLCDIVLELGEEYLSETCHTHPRHEEVYPNVRERSLALTCPTVCKQVLTRREPVKILHYNEKEKKEHDRFFDWRLFRLLLRTRDVMLHIAQNREYSIAERMIMVLGSGHDVESRIRQRSLRKKSGWLQNIFPVFPGFTGQEQQELRKISKAYQGKNAFAKVEKRLDEIIYDEKYFRQESEESAKTIMTDMIFALSTMEALKPSWPPYLQSVLNIREEMTREESRKQMALYHTQEDEVPLEQLLVYFLYVYCCSSVYDEQLLAKCKMAVVNVMLIRELWFMKWYENDHKLTIDDQVEIAHWFVREIENSDENMEQWDSLMQRNPRFALKKILKVLRSRNL